MASTSTAQHQYGLTAYELERELKIQENKERMAALGIKVQTAALQDASRPPAAKRVKMKVETETGGARRSLRCQGIKAEMTPEQEALVMYV